MGKTCQPPGHIPETGTSTMPARRTIAKRKTVAERQRDIQAEVALADRNKSKKEGNGAMQAGARHYPEPPFPNSTSQSRGRKRGWTPAHV